MIWHLSKNIKSTRPTKELSERLFGAFPILNEFGTNAYHLKLPSKWKFIFPFLHISLLEPVKTSIIPNWHEEPAPPIIIEEEDEWEVSHTEPKAQEGKIMVFGGMERFQSRPRKIHLGTN
ncbi:hypothetical protein O181_069879 [Austropuccinia psidii MF-1]|uniref:Tf2-1-like SH3-like domain-containing protein n=1 Tax=Austropuccinia psidii MF-1 TaxID=1389203 RepID=A0A9Q3F055_9BASI|nr:hypothetical protein [Austropuccinia psidii MF-1]